MARLFLAVGPPEEVTEQLMSLPRKDQPGVRFVRPENWHITLRFLGEADPDDVSERLAGIRLGATTARLGPGVDVIHERALVIPVHGLDAISAAVAERTRAIGTPSRKRFNGHLTIARVKAHAPMPRALGMLVSAEFAVGEIALVLSRLHQDRARYETVETWPVGTRPATF